MTLILISPSKQICIVCYCRFSISRCRPGPALTSPIRSPSTFTFSLPELCLHCIRRTEFYFYIITYRSTRSWYRTTGLSTAVVKSVLSDPGGALNNLSDFLAHRFWFWFWFGRYLGLPGIWKYCQIGALKLAPSNYSLCRNGWLWWNTSMEGRSLKGSRS